MQRIHKICLKAFGIAATGTTVGIEGYHIVKLFPAVAIPILAVVSVGGLAALMTWLLHPEGASNSFPNFMKDFGFPIIMFIIAAAFIFGVPGLAVWLSR